LFGKQSELALLIVLRRRVLLRRVTRRALTQLRLCNVNGRWQKADRDVVCFRLAQWTNVRNNGAAGFSER